MSTEPLFNIPQLSNQETITITFEGKQMTVPKGISVAAALLLGGARDFRSSVVGMMPRAPYCMMGVCFECFVEIDGMPARQSCLVLVRHGMQVLRQSGAVDINGISAEDCP